MGPLTWFLFVYVLGGLTFLPLSILVLFLHAYYYLPQPVATAPDVDEDVRRLRRPDDDKVAFKSGTDTLAEQFQRRHDTDVAAGYFAVCREYVPGGVNGKPPDKLTPAGEVGGQESPSVYQSMYRSIFDRTQKPTIEPNKEAAAGKAPKKANNVFYVVLRHGHLMLYDDFQQLEVRYVISLEYHDVDIYGGGDDIPEGELWIKRHAIRLRRRKTRAGDTPSSLPFFFFGENLSEKEDFYFALLKNQEKSAPEDAPIAQQFDVDHIVKLVQKLHSSEEHLQTRWLNAMVGRLFLAMYKTAEFERFVRTKLTKKVSRVKKPTFITKLALRKIDLGTGAPSITNPRLKDLTVNGDCTVEADVTYNGNFRIEIAATARIELGARFKPREVDMILAATCKRLDGHVLVRFKPPPSNRLWFAFEKMPHLDLALEPIVSSRQITYTFILRAIESRIREVVAESICLPFWDDIPFLDTLHQRHRGGIWERELELEPSTSTEIPTDDGADDDADMVDAATPGAKTPVELTRHDRVMSMPALPDTKSPTKAGAGKKAGSSLGPSGDLLGIKGPDGGEKPAAAKPILMRSSSLVSPSSPTVTANHADADTLSRDPATSRRRESVASFLKDLSAKSASGNPSPSASHAGSPPTESTMPPPWKDHGLDGGETIAAVGRASQDGPTEPLSSLPRSPVKPSSESVQAGDVDDAGAPRESAVPGPATSNSRLALAARSLTSTDRKQALASVNAAATAAQKWSWGVLARNRQRDRERDGTAAPDSPRPDDLPTIREPMGRGRPLPPPGIPLPPPPKSSKTPALVVPKRRLVPPPFTGPSQPTNGASDTRSARAGPKPPLPDRRKRHSSRVSDEGSEADVLVVEAPTESAPTTPSVDDLHDEFFGHSELRPEPTGEGDDAGDRPLSSARSDSPSPHMPGESEEMRRQEIGLYN